MGAAPPAARGFWRRLVLARLAALRSGRLELREGPHRLLLGCEGPRSGALAVHDPAFYRRVALGGSLGLCEAYLDGLWDAEDLPATLGLLASDTQAVHRTNRLAAWFKAAPRWLLGVARANTRRGSRRNIASHYDLSNDFYRLWLDETMTYSSGYFPQPGASLAEASREKLDRVCRRLRLGPTDRVIEVGGGWGGFAEHAASRYGCHVTTTTISRAQHDYARERFDRAGLAGRVTLLDQDYRDLRGRYDKLVSIEMIEAVGHAHLGRFFQRCGALLKPNGLMALQAITIPDQRYDAYRRSADFIQKHVFPGGALPSLGAITRCVARHTDLRLVHAEDFGPHYARTLALWRARFEARLPEVRDLGFDDRFVRLWRLYLAYCEAGFAERLVGVSQLVFAKPGADAVCAPL